MGDALTAGAGQPVQIVGRVRGAAGNRLRLIGSAGLIAEMPIDSDDLAFDHQVALRMSSYVRAEVAEPLAPEEAHEPAALMLQALSNPIYVQVI